MENLSKKKKIITYVSIGIICFLIISVIYFMVNTKLREAKFNEELENSFLKLADAVVYDYNYSDKSGLEGRVLMAFDLKDKILVEKMKDGSQVEEGVLLASYDGKKKIKISLPQPMILEHDLKGQDLDGADLIEKNKAVNAAKIKIEADLMGTDAVELLRDRFKIVLREFLRAKGYKEVEIDDK